MCSTVEPILPGAVTSKRGDSFHEVARLSGNCPAFAAGASVTMNNLKAFKSAQKRRVETILNFNFRLFPYLTITSQVDLIESLA